MKERDPMADDEQAPTPEEAAGADALRLLLEGRRTGRGDADLEAARLIAAVSGREPPLGDLAARRAVTRALAEAGRRGVRTRWRIVAAALGAAAAVGVFFLAAPGEVPRRWMSRPGGLLVPGPFPRQQTAAQRLDLVAADRLLAFRESSFHRGRR